MIVDMKKRYVTAEDYFDLGGSAVMRLSREAAIAVCNKAVAYELVVVRIEGGVWHSPGFEARFDCIWDGAEPPVDVEGASKNNQAAANFIQSERAEYDVFVLTSPSINGW